LKYPFGTVVAIDGPASSGKTAVGGRAAEDLEMAFISTGKMYRASAVLLRCADFPASRVGNRKAVGLIKGATMLYTSNQRVLVNGHDVTNLLGDPETTALTPHVAQVPEIREHLVAWQREFVESHGGTVMEGRDIGTVVFPNTPMKFFLDASPEIRALREHKKDMEAGRHGKSVRELADAIRERDRMDSERAISPLIKASDAEVIDTSPYDISEVVQRVVDTTRRRLRSVAA
jgi:cytidylate kinase